MRKAESNRQRHPIVWIASVLCLLSFTSSLCVSAAGDNAYYQRYKKYPVYCSDPSEMETRGIPPLQPDQNMTTYKSRLYRVTAIIRHGARTPIHSKNCWKGHWDEPDGIWDCKLTTILSTRPYNYKSDADDSNHPVNENDDDDKGQFFVEKIYDAFEGEKVPSPYRNTMNGTCQDGQLIQQGYDQQIRNGQHLRAAYVKDVDNQQDEDSIPNNIDFDPRLWLFSTANILDGIRGCDNWFLDDFLRYRSDDDQRTLASGQVLLSSMFEPEALAYREINGGRIPVVEHHTADKQNDILNSKRGTTICPKQRDVQKRGLASEEYLAFYNSEESKTMRRLIDDHLEPEGVHFGGSDCMMTSICTDRSIPDVINDYGHENSNETDAFTKEYGPNRFERLRNYVVQNKTFLSRYNDSELSKMDMGPLWAEIMDSNEKFSLFSGHDSTIFPLMASLGERVWNATDFPAYASMMLIEFHEVIDKALGLQGHPPAEFPSGMAFRLVYNGKVLTWLMDGCPEYSHLCDISVFEKRVTPFATRRHHGCGVEEGGDATSTTSESTMTKKTLQPRPLSFWIASMLSSFCFGSILTFVVMKCCQWRPRTKHRNESQLVSTGNNNGDSFIDEPDVIIN